jgi:hypothetical protein
VPAPAPTIIGEQAIFRRRINKRGKPVGKAVLAGFTLEFSRPMSASAGNPDSYQLETVRARTHGKSDVAQTSGVGISVSYDAASDTVTVSTAGMQSFPKGGILRVSTAVAGADGASLAGSSTFAIAVGGKTIIPASD